MNLVTLRTTIETYLYSNWSTTPIVWENIDNINLTDASQNILTKGTDPFIALEIRVFNSTTITVPGHCIRYAGALEFAVFTREGIGGRTGDALTDSLIALFERKHLGTLPDVVRFKNIITSTKYDTPSGWRVNEISFAFEFERFSS